MKTNIKNNLILFSAKGMLSKAPGASSFLWIDDLSAMDPYFVLPILNGLGMYMSQKMTPTPPSADPMTAQMMKFMPVMFAVVFAWFPSGLVLYWLINMFVQIIQQWWYSRTPITKH